MLFRIVIKALIIAVKVQETYTIHEQHGSHDNNTNEQREKHVDDRGHGTMVANDMTRYSTDTNTTFFSHFDKNNRSRPEAVEAGDVYRHQRQTVVANDTALNTTSTRHSTAMKRKYSSSKRKLASRERAQQQSMVELRSLYERRLVEEVDISSIQTIYLFNLRV